MKNNISIIFLSSFIFILINTGEVFCAGEATARTEQLEDKVTGAKEQALVESQAVPDLIELLKQRALLKLKEKKRKHLLKVNLFSSVASGYETNVYNDSSNKGDFFSNQFLMLSWEPMFTPQLGLNIRGLSYNQVYSELTDNNYLYSSIDTALRWYPFLDGKLRLEPGAGYETLWYEHSSESSYYNTKYFLNTRNFLSPKWIMDLNFEFSFKEYDAAKARDSNQGAMEYVREDKRYTIDTGLTWYMGGFSISLQEKVYKNISNDNYQDFNDYDSYKSSLNLGGAFLDKRLYIALTPNFERKNYKERLAVDTARFDDRYNWRGAIYYTLTKNYTINYKFDYYSLDSNNPAAEYKNIIHQIGVSARF